MASCPYVNEVSALSTRGSAGKEAQNSCIVMMLCVGGILPTREVATSTH